MGFINKHTTDHSVEENCFVSLGFAPKGAINPNFAKWIPISGGFTDLLGINIYHIYKDIPSRSAISGGFAKFANGKNPIIDSSIIHVQAQRV